MNFYEWSAMAVGSYRTMSAELKAELLEWESQNLNGSIGTSDWPGWIDLIGAPPPMLERTASKSNGSKLSDRTRKDVFERDGYRCRECNSWLDLTVDHIHPQSRGGSDHLSNLQTLCRSCNSRKGIR